jgi:predicted aminopeptidase
MHKVCWKLALIVVSIGVLTGCMGARYVAQAACGQIDLMFATRPLESALADENTPPRVRELLSHVASIKRFGERQGLRPTASYSSYADLNRRAAVWVVTASQPLRFEMKSWSFPIVGSVTYLGWFDRGDATEFAGELHDEGWDVDVRPAAAYSTLGWFSDPVLSTMIPQGDEALGELANVVLHESVHATFYVEGQTALNESVANFIGDALAEVYLDEARGPTSSQKEAYLQGQREGERRAVVMHAAYKRLADLYASPATAREKLTEKARILAELRGEIRARRPINNATLAQFKTYSSGKAELEALRKACGGSFSRMLSALRKIPPSAFSRAHDRDLARIFSPLVKGGCPIG